MFSSTIPINNCPATAPARGSVRGRGHAASFISHGDCYSFTAGHRGAYTDRGRGFGYPRRGSFRNNPETPIARIFTITQVPISGSSAATESLSSTNSSRYFNPQATPFSDNNSSSHSASFNPPHAPSSFANHSLRGQQSRKAFHNSRRFGNMPNSGAHASSNGSPHAQGGPQSSQHQPFGPFNNTGAGRARRLSNPVWRFSFGFVPKNVEYAEPTSVYRPDVGRDTLLRPQSDYGPSTFFSSGYDYTGPPLTVDSRGNTVLYYPPTGPSQYVSSDYPALQRQNHPYYGQEPRRQSVLNANAAVFVPATRSPQDSDDRVFDPNPLTQATQTPASATPSPKTYSKDDIRLKGTDLSLLYYTVDPAEFPSCTHDTCPGFECLNSEPRIFNPKADLKEDLERVTLSDVLALDEAVHEEKEQVPECDAPGNSLVRCGGVVVEAEAEGAETVSSDRGRRRRRRASARDRRRGGSLAGAKPVGKL